MTGRLPEDRGLDLTALADQFSAEPRLHAIGLQHYWGGTDAVELLPAVVEHLATGSRATVLTDATPKRRGDQDLASLLREQFATSDAVTDWHVLGDHEHPPMADEATIGRAIEAVHGSRVVVSVGSGTMTDIGKLAAASVGAEHVAVQTAASVNGFADDQSVVLRNGVKRTVPSRWPTGLVVDGQVLADAPVSMNLAGVGDLMSMFSAVPDWYLANQLGFDDSWSPAVFALLCARSTDVLQWPNGVSAGDPDTLVQLAEMLALSGLTMGAVGNTAPSSGLEHLISHMIEMDADARGQAIALHGARVGVGTLLASAAWEMFTERVGRGQLNLRVPDADEVRPLIEEAFSALDPSGAMAAECWKACSRKLTWFSAHEAAVKAVLGRWDEHLTFLKPILRTPSDLASAVRESDFPDRFSSLVPPVGDEQALWAVKNCWLMRDRITIADLAMLTGNWKAADVDTILSSVMGKQ